MTATNVRVQMQQRSDTAANWTAAGPTLLAGEIGYETDTGKFKIGDGTTAWGSLAYLPIPDGSGNLTIAGNLEIGSTGTLTFEGSTANDFETTLAVTDPTADRTITLPDVSGTVVTTGDTGSVTSTMIADGTIVDADVSPTAEIAVSKLANGTANQVLVTDGTDVSWSDDLTLAGDFTVPLGTAAAPSIHFSGDTNTGIYSPAADQLALSTNGTGRLFVDASGNVGVGTSSPGRVFGISRSIAPAIQLTESSTDKVDEVVRASNNLSIRAGETDSTGTSAIEFRTNAQNRMYIDSSGRLLVGTSSDSGGALLQVNGDRIRVATAKTPASATATGTAGEICWDADYIYVCTATNTWKRAALSTW